MHVQRLRLRDFRNYSHTDVALAPGLNVLVGANGQGKTNLLEAIHLAAGRNPPRFGGNSRLIRWGRPEARIEASVHAAAAEPSLTVEIRPTARRVLVNGKHIRSLAASPLSAALFCPETLCLVKDGANARRDLLDDLIERHQPAYARVRADYGRVLRQRNKTLQSGPRGRSQLSVWDERLCQLGVEMTSRRIEMTSRASPLVSEAYAMLGGTAKDLVDVAYSSGLVATNGSARADVDPEDIAASFERQLRERREDELARGVTLVGPHRDDLVLKLDGHDLRGFGSQGEQRTAALALVLAEAHLLHRATREQPVLLLDDVLSELDQQRRDRLLEHVAAEGQALVTATSVSALGNAASSAHILNVEGGTVVHG